LTARLYYTLMQPANASSIHLARFDIKKRTKTIVPMETTVAFGQFVDGRIVGIDDDGVNIYFGIVNPLNGKCVVKTVIEGNYSFSDASLTIDAANHTAYFVLGPKGGGNAFHLFAFSTRTGSPVRETVQLRPTPDAQGPLGFKYIGRDRITAFMPPIDGGWELVVISSLTGEVTTTNAMAAIPGPPMRVFQEGASWLVKMSLPSGKEGLVLAAGMGLSLGMPLSMISFDVGCVLESNTATIETTPRNCTLSIKPWPAGRAQPTDIGVYYG